MNIGLAFETPAAPLSGVDLTRQRRTQRLVDSHLRRRGRPDHDSVVVAGNGIGALSFAARLARSPEFAGRVTVVAPPIAESRRLINGVSLRGRAADYICAALGVTHARLLSEICGGEAGGLTANRQTAAMAYAGAGGAWQFTRPGAWQGGAAGSARPIVYGTRNSRITGAMWSLMTELGIRYVPEKAESADQLRAMAAGSAPLLVNPTVNGRLLGAAAPPPTRMVLATQVPFTVAAGGLRRPAEPQTAFAPLVRRDGAVDVGYFTPFRDPASPQATWYGIIARVVDTAARVDKDSELSTMTDELYGIGAALGLEPHDPEETLGRAMVPASPVRAPGPSAPGTLELKRAYSVGAPCYYADGMISAGLGGLLAAEAVIRGDDPDRAIRHATRALRWHNYLWWLETTRIPLATDLLMRLNVNLAMAYPHSAGFRLWAASA